MILDAKYHDFVEQNLEYTMILRGLFEKLSEWNKKIIYLLFINNCFKIIDIF